MNEDADVYNIDYADAELKIAYGLATRREVEALERIATALERIQTGLYGVILGVFLFTVLVVVFYLTATLFEDGSVQFFNKAGLGFCLFPNWGCS